MRAHRVLRAAPLALAIAALVACDRESTGTGDDSVAPIAITTSEAEATATPTATPEPEPEEEPSTWPEGFPWIPGGTMLPATREGAVHVARAAWPVRAEALDTLLRAELADAGWAADPTTEEEGVLRMVARRGDRELALSIYPDDQRTIVQTMELRLE